MCVREVNEHSGASAGEVGRQSRERTGELLDRVRVAEARESVAAPAVKVSTRQEEER